MNNALPPYEKVSLIYDSFLDHINYPDWADYIMEISDLHDREPNSVCDMACGTGSFLNEMAKKGLKSSGVEISSTMLAAAKSKYGDGHISFEEGNMLTAQLPEKVDLITCLFDSLNYCNSATAFTDFINNSAKQLNKNGLLIFDAVTQKACKEYFFDYSEKDTVDKIYYERHCKYDIKKNEQHSRFYFEINGESFEEKHVQYIYSVEDIQKAIDASDMQFLAAYSDFTEEGLDRFTERAHFVLGLK